MCREILNLRSKLYSLDAPSYLVATFEFRHNKTCNFNDFKIEIDSVLSCLFAFSP